MTTKPNKGQFQKGWEGGPGRPSKYTPELGDEICARLAAGESLRQICRDDSMPDESAVRGWALNLEHPFSPLYTRAREIGYHGMADEVLEIADDGRNDTLTDEDGNEITNQDVIQRSRLRVDTRKWILAKMLPKIYGDKITQEVTGKDGTALVPVLNVTIGKPKTEE